VGWGLVGLVVLGVVRVLDRGGGGGKRTALPEILLWSLPPNHCGIFHSRLHMGCAYAT